MWFMAARASLAFSASHRPLALPPTPFHYTSFRPIGLATENEEKRREGFRAFLSPIFLLNFSANISAV